LVGIAEYLIGDYSKIPEGTIVPAGKIKRKTEAALLRPGGSSWVSRAGMRMEME
jgi:hypothetical protein